MTPEELGLARWPVKALCVTSAASGAEAVREVLAGEPGARRDVVLANAAAVAVVAALADTLPDGVALAAEAIDSGRARDALERLVAVSNS